MRRQIQTLNLKNKGICIGTGWGLGILSSFLGIGGGPTNLVVLYYFVFPVTTFHNSLKYVYLIK